MDLGTLPQLGVGVQGRNSAAPRGPVFKTVFIQQLRFEFTYKFKSVGLIAVRNPNVQRILTLVLLFAGSHQVPPLANNLTGIQAAHFLGSNEANFAFASSNRLTLGVNAGSRLPKLTRSTRISLPSGSL